MDPVMSTFPAERYPSAFTCLIPILISIPEFTEAYLPTDKHLTSYLSIMIYMTFDLHTTFHKKNKF